MLEHEDLEPTTASSLKEYNREWLADDTKPAGKFITRGAGSLYPSSSSHIYSRYLLGEATNADRMILWI